MRTFSLTALAILLGGCCPLTQNKLLFVPEPSEPQPLYVCCDDDGCQGTETLASCPPASDVYTCEAGEMTTINGKPAVICHD